MFVRSSVGLPLWSRLKYLNYYFMFFFISTDVHGGRIWSALTDRLAFPQVHPCDLKSWAQKTAPSKRTHHENLQLKTFSDHEDGSYSTDL